MMERETDVITPVIQEKLGTLDRKTQTVRPWTSYV